MSGGMMVEFVNFVAVFTMVLFDALTEDYAFILLALGVACLLLALLAAPRKKRKRGEEEKW